MDYADNYRLTTRRALVCGSTQGIGLACAERFAQLGAAVTLMARDQAALKRITESLPKTAGQNHDDVCVDFNDPDAVGRAANDYVAKHGPIHVLLNNSGGPPPGPIIEAKPEDFRQAMRRHLICNQLLAQAVLPGMKSAKYGRIINIISTSVKEPIRGLGVSNVTRWAVAAWAKTLSVEVAPFGVTVNNILPGFTATARLEQLIQKRAEQTGVSTDQIRKEMVASAPIGRFADPAEIAAAAGFLASPAASYINGINLPVDGGRLGSL